MKATPKAVHLMPNPVHKEDDGWYFYDETWSDRFGPFPTEEDANKARVVYATTQLEGKPNPYPDFQAPSQADWDSNRLEEGT